MALTGQRRTDDAWTTASVAQRSPYCGEEISNAFAREVLDARMVDLMVSTEGKITFEFLGRWLLLHTEQIEPELLPGLARLADEMRQVVPALVAQKWGRAPAE